MNAAFIWLIPYFISLIISAGVTAFAFKRRSVQGAMQFALFSLCQTLWIFGYLVETLSTTIRAKITWDDLQFVALAGITFFIPLFAYAYSKPEKTLKKSRLVLLAIVPLFFIWLVYTNPVHLLIRTSAELVTGGGITSLYYPFTTAILAFSVYTYAISIYAIVLIARHQAYKNGRLVNQAIIICTGLTIPLLVGIFVVTDSLPRYMRDVLPLSFGISNIVLAIGLFRYHLFDIIPIAREAILENMPIAVLVIDPANRVVDVNAEAIRLLEKDRPGIIGQSINHVASAYPDVLKKYALAMNAHDTLKVPVNGREYLFDLNIRPVYEHDILLGRVITLNDITEHHMIEQELKVRTAQMEYAYKELESFSYSVSHDLRSPLRTISGYIRILREDFSATMAPEALYYLHRINDGVYRMNTLISDLLEFSKISRKAISKTSISLAEIASQAFQELRENQEDTRNIEFIVQEMPLVKADPALLKQVYLNLLGNAIKYTRPRELTIIEVGCQPENGTTAFFVRDNGVGFNMEYADKLFGVFQRLHNESEFEGTGIGLATVQNIIQRHGGNIWAESIPEQGACFYFTLA